MRRGSHLRLVEENRKGQLHRALSVAVVMLAVVCGLPLAAQDCAGPALRGSFLQPRLAGEWSPEQWRTEFQYMKVAGIDELILQWTADSLEKTTVYPASLAGYVQTTSHDVVEGALREADASGARVYLGLQTNDEWWAKYLDDRDWLKREAKIAKALAGDLWQMYRHHRSFAGWYLGFEVNNVRSGKPEWNNLAAFYRKTGRHLHKITPGKPVIVSPFFNAKADLSPVEWQRMWEHVLRRSAIDVIALQDGVGVLHACRPELPEWFAATKEAIRKSRKNVQLWADTETFNADGEPMAIREMVNDMCAVRPYVNKHIGFSFGHFLSPQQVTSLYYEAYLHYLRTRTLPGDIPVPPAGLRTTALNARSIRLAWESDESSRVAGYKIHRDGRHVATSYSSAASYVDAELDSGTTYSYEISAFDAAGNESAKSGAAIASTPQTAPAPVNIALHKPYTATLAADAGFPDGSGRELTDGNLGPIDRGDRAWQGRATTATYSFDIDLGAMEAIREIRSHWAQDKAEAVYLPEAVGYQVAGDDRNFAEAGTVRRPALPDEELSRWYSVTDLKDVTAKHVRVNVTPGWNAGWTFIDEIEVRR